MAPSTKGILQLREKLDKFVNTLSRFEDTNFRGEKPYTGELRKEMKGFAVLALEGMLLEIAAYGTNTHTFAVAKAYLNEFRGTV